MKHVYDRDGKPMTMKQWERLTRDEYKRVAYDTVGDVAISTIWLGIDHQFGEGPPLIFETMIFGIDSDLDQEQWRYSTEAEAIAGHKRAMEMVRDG